MLKKGKLYIIGDSYSTFEGCIPEGFAAWYFSGGTDATDVTEKKRNMVAYANKQNRYAAAFKQQLVGHYNMQYHIRRRVLPRYLVYRQV